MGLGIFRPNILCTWCTRILGIKSGPQSPKETDQQETIQLISHRYSHYSPICLQDVLDEVSEARPSWANLQCTWTPCWHVFASVSWDTGATSTLQMFGQISHQPGTFIGWTVWSRHRRCEEAWDYAASFLVTVCILYLTTCLLCRGRVLQAMPHVHPCPWMLNAVCERCALPVLADKTCSLCELTRTTEGLSRGLKHKEAKGNLRQSFAKQPLDLSKPAWNS